MQFLNIDIRDVTSEELLQQLRQGVLITPNVDQMVKLQKDREFYDIVRRTEWVVCDSKILLLCSKLLKHPLREAIPRQRFLSAVLYASQG